MSPENSPSSPVFLSAGDTALVIQYGEVVDVSINRMVRQLAHAVRQLDTPGIVDIVPTMRSLMIHYDPLSLTKQALIDAVQPLLYNLEELENGLYPSVMKESLLLISMKSPRPQTLQLTKL